jgi:hypothetical protein
MRRALPHVLLIVAALVAVPAIPATAKPPRLATTLIVPGASVGGVSFGMTVAQARAAWGRAVCMPARHPHNCAWDGTAKQAGIDVSIAKGRIIGFSLTPGGDGRGPLFGGSVGTLRTAAGIGLGSTETALLAAYSGLHKQQGGVGLNYELRSGKHRTQFAVDPDRRVVTSIGLG